MPVDRADVARVALEGTWQGEDFVCVLHFHQASNIDLTITDLDNIAGDLGDTSANAKSLAKFWENFDTGSVINTLHVTTLADVDPLGVDYSVNIAGTSTAGDTPAFVALVAKWGTGFASRRRQGRTYIPGLNTGMWQSGDPDRLDTSFASGVATDLAAFRAAWEADVNYSFVIFSQVQELATPGTGTAVVVTSAVNPVVGVQRRRKPTH